MAREVQKRQGFLGIAEHTLPHPVEVTFEEVASGIPLSRLRVSHLTQTFSEHSQAPPEREAAWKKALGEQALPWHLVPQKVHHPALSSKDTNAALRLLAARYATSQSWRHARMAKTDFHTWLAAPTSVWPKSYVFSSYCDGIYR